MIGTSASIRHGVPILLRVRSLPSDATIHSSVTRRFALAGVQHADGVKPYRPDALRQVEAFRYGYPVVTETALPNAAGMNDFIAGKRDR